MQKKNNSKPSKDEQTRNELAKAISTILRNPQTPTDLYRAISDIVSGWNAEYLDTYETEPEHLAEALACEQRAEARRTRGE